MGRGFRRWRWRRWVPGKHDRLWDPVLETGLAKAPIKQRREGSPSCRKDGADMVRVRGWCPKQPLFYFSGWIWNLERGRASFPPFSHRPAPRLPVTPPRAETKKEAAPPLCFCSCPGDRAAAGLVRSPSLSSTLTPPSLSSEGPEPRCRVGSHTHGSGGLHGCFSSSLAGCSPPLGWPAWWSRAGGTTGVKHDPIPPHAPRSSGL